MDIWIVIRTDGDKDSPQFLGLFIDDHNCELFVEAYCKENGIAPEDKDEIIEVRLLEA